MVKNISDIRFTHYGYYVRVDFRADLKGDSYYFSGKDYPCKVLFFYPYKGDKTEIDSGRVVDKKTTKHIKDNIKFYVEYAARTNQPCVYIPLGDE